MDPVQHLHNEAARSSSAAVASVRPPGTTDRQLRAVVRHITRVLRVDAQTSVLDLGCGTGVIGLPLARVARSYVGVDFASEAVAVLRGRIEAAGLSDRAQVEERDIFAGTETPRFGTFDRVVVYAAAHFVHSDEEGIRFAKTALENLTVGGTALLGSLPLSDLGIDWQTGAATSSSAASRRLAFLRWMAQPSRSHVPLSRTWKVRFAGLSAVARWESRRTPGGEAPAIAAGHLVELDTLRVEGWARATGIPCTMRWSPPSPSESLAERRADLLLTRLA